MALAWHLEKLFWEYISITPTKMLSVNENNLNYLIAYI